MVKRQKPENQRQKPPPIIIIIIMIIIIIKFIYVAYSKTDIVIQSVLYNYYNNS